MFPTDSDLDRALDTLSPSVARDDAALARVHGDLLAHMAADRSPDVAPRRAAATMAGRRLRRILGRLAIPLATAAAVAAVGAAVWPTSAHDGADGTARGPATGSSGGPSATVRQADVRLVAYTAARNIVATDTPVPSGQYLRLTTVIQDGGSHRVDTTWVPADPASRTAQWVRQSDGEVTSGFCGNLYGPGTYGPNDEFQLPPGDEADRSCDRAGNWRDQTPVFVAQLAKLGERQLAASLATLACPDPDPAASAGLCADGKPNRSGLEVMFSHVSALLRSGLTSADLSARLYKVVASLPGVTAQTGVTNADGTTGNALIYDNVGNTSTMVIDPTTGRLIGTREQLNGNAYADAIERTLVTSSSLPEPTR